jgi:hypothetical protein
MKSSKPNSDGLIKCLPQPGQLLGLLPKSMRLSFTIAYQTSATRTDPATKTKSIGLLADARVVMFFAMPSRQLYRDRTNPAHLSGLVHLDSLIVTPNARPSIGTLQKHMPTLTRTATN